ncbi:MAG: succinate dehydrogenase assembly factor 2 [Lautropia sp.]|nr:succinate dehydrogenase assembly factor 2 [Lautropia sp.]
MLSSERIRRIRWRARRGLLENDILLTRYLDANEQLMTDEQVTAFDQLLDLSDPELLDLILRRADPSGPLDCPPVHRLVEDLRQA